MRTPIAALLLAALVGITPGRAETAPARPSQEPTRDSAFRATPPFEVVPRAAEQKHSYKWVWITALGGAALVGASFPLADEADRLYGVYLAETDVALIDERYLDTQRMDRFASGSLIAGEVLLATAVWLRFVRGSQVERVVLDLRPSRCAVALRF